MMSLETDLLFGCIAAWKSFEGKSFFEEWSESKPQKA